MRIGELAKAGAVSTSLLRYYEEQGLLSPLPPVPRRAIGSMEQKPWDDWGSSSEPSPSG